MSPWPRAFAGQASHAGLGGPLQARTPAAVGECLPGHAPTQAALHRTCWTVGQRRAASVSVNIVDTAHSGLPLATRLRIKQVTLTAWRAARHLGHLPTDRKARAALQATYASGDRGERIWDC